jgi:hypothetical protein
MTPELIAAMAFDTTAARIEVKSIQSGYDEPVFNMLDHALAAFDMIDLLSSEIARLKECQFDLSCEINHLQECINFNSGY